MFAVVTIAGQQFRVQANDELFVHRLAGNAGESVEFSDVLMTSDGGNVAVGSAVKAVVKAEIIDHLKGDKVLIFKKKRRKGYQKLNGHRQALTKIRIQAIA
ncbi:50S ribosomal protein L21 [Taibaiella helva]|uniref:50S ribosomal protein L21 n=1 Tax=Taibaiella helva TaxID=2301235 RepID=UPI000E58FCF9|nr:50S ribosomal protein L21 [Taibaiella helva]